MQKFLIRGDRTATIEVVEVLRETAESVYVSVRGFGGVKERREGKRTQYSEYHDTWEEAHAALLKRAEGGLVAARRVLQSAQDFKGNVVGMKAPSEPEGMT